MSHAPLRIASPIRSTKGEYFMKRRLEWLDGRVFMNLKVTEGLFGTFEETWKREKNKRGGREREEKEEVRCGGQCGEAAGVPDQMGIQRGEARVSSVQQWGRSGIECIKFSYEHQCTA